MSGGGGRPKPTPAPEQAPAVLEPERLSALGEPTTNRASVYTPQYAPATAPSPLVSPYGLSMQTPWSMARGMPYGMGGQYGGSPFFAPPAYGMGGRYGMGDQYGGSPFFAPPAYGMGGRYGMSPFAYGMGGRYGMSPFSMMSPFAMREMNPEAMQRSQAPITAGQPTQTAPAASADQAAYAGGGIVGLLKR